MSVFLSTMDGRILLADIEQRRYWEMADFAVGLNDLALTRDGGLLGATDTLVYRLDIGSSSKTPIALVSDGGGIVGLDVDGSDRALIATASGQIWRQERDGSLSDIGLFETGIQGMARVGGFVFAATDDGTISVMNILNGAVTPLIAHGLGDIDSISAEGRMLRLSVTPGSSQPQFFTFNPETLELTFENGLLGFYEQVSGATHGTLETVSFSGGGGDEEFIGTALDDILTGMDGDDRLYARSGDDTLSGGAGDDLMMGEAGIDHLDGGAGDDVLNGGVGNDWALFESAAATVDLVKTGPQNTGHGIDLLVSIENLRGSDEDDKFLGSYDNNILETGAGNDTIRARSGDDTLRGGAGDDELRGGDGDDVIDGGAGFDIASYAGSDGVVVTLSTTFAQDTGGRGIDVLRNIEGLTGSAGADDLAGNARANRLEGWADNDTLRGGNGQDTLFGQKGDDYLHGGAGSDTLNGGNGNDTLDGGRWSGINQSTGGAGADVFIFVVESAQGRMDPRLVITDFDATEGDRIRLTGADPDAFDSWDISALSDGRDALVTFANGTEIELWGVNAEEVAVDWFT